MSGAGPAETLALAGNEPRQEFLFRIFEALVPMAGRVDFDHIDPVTRYAAALLSYARPRTEWWGNYQMHPLVQRRRRRVLHDGLRALPATPDVLLTWGSWFDPLEGWTGRPFRFYCYVDQSRSLEALEGEAPAAGARRRASHALQRRTYDAADAVFTMSEWARDQTLAAHDVAPSKVHAVGWGPCAVDLSAEEPDFTRDEPVVLHVSNNFQRKGVDVLVAAARELPAVRFVVVGRDSSGLALDAPPNVTFTGPVAGAALAEHFRRASVFLLPFRFDRSPHVLVEAMSAGLPLVASAQGGAIELLRDGVAGRLCPVGDVGAVVAAVSGLLGDETARRAAGRAAWERMRAWYTWPAIAERMLAVMHLAGRRP